MSYVLIALIFLSCAVITTALVVAALALSSQISQEEGVEERPYAPDPDTEQLQRFPHDR